MAWNGTVIDPRQVYLCLVNAPYSKCHILIIYKQCPHGEVFICMLLNKTAERGMNMTFVLCVAVALFFS